MERDPNAVPMPRTLAREIADPCIDLTEVMNRPWPLPAPMKLDPANHAEIIARLSAAIADVGTEQEAA